jgi:hypothetical protein
MKRNGRDAMNDGEEESHLIHKPSTRNGTPELLPRG